VVGAGDVGEDGGFVEAVERLRELVFFTIRPRDISVVTHRPFQPPSAA
jgi:hypothetical protein